MTHPSQLITVTCLPCGKIVEMLLESDQRGERVQDCEVCCNPWRLSVRPAGEDLEVGVDRLAG